MARIENPASFIRSTAGAPLTILVVLTLAGRPLRGYEIREWTAFSEHTITETLRLLTSLGWVMAESARGPWAIADGKQIPLLLPQAGIESGEAKPRKSRNRLSFKRSCQS